MNGENRPLVTDEPVEFNLRTNWWRLHENLPVILEESMENTSNYERGTE